MKKILLSVFTILTAQFSFAQLDVLNFHSKDAIVYRNDVNKIDSVIFKTSNIDSVLVYSSGKVAYINNVAKIDSMNFSKFYGCNVPPSSEVVIGTQTWTTTNLNVDKFRNGDVIPEAKTDAEWISAGNARTPAWCYYLNSVDSGAKYGKLYNCYAVTDPRGLAPIGWHVPSDAEWTTLTTYLDLGSGSYVAGGKMKNTCGWNTYIGVVGYDPYGNPIYSTTVSISGNGSNTSGFAGLPSGSRNSYGHFSNVGRYGFWWSSTEYYANIANNVNDAWYRLLGNGDAEVTRYHNSKSGGLPVRCVRD